MIFSYQTIPISNKGFTLIELLVVISVIALLSSIVLTSVQSAKLKAKDTVIKQEVLELRKLAELEKADTGSYAGMQPGLFQDSPSDCSQVANPFSPPGPSFSSVNYAQTAKSICVKILTLSSGNSPLMASVFIPNNNAYSFQAYLPGKGAYFCLGSSGRSSSNENSAYGTQPGCYGSP